MSKQEKLINCLHKANTSVCNLSFLLNSKVEHMKKVVANLFGIIFIEVRISAFGMELYLSIFLPIHRKGKFVLYILDLSRLVRLEPAASSSTW